MVGANYMGGKRSTARTKSKDVVGRAQRRHFGKQRLASALCATRENRARPGPRTLSSGLPEITLAHARHHASTDSGAAFSRHVFSGNGLYSATSSSDMTCNKPSKALGTPDTLDHTSMRAAIKCILQQPNLVGINTTDHKDAACMQLPLLAGRPTDAHLHSKDPDAQHSNTISKRVFDPYVGQSQVDRHHAAVNLNTIFSSTPSPPNSPLRTWDTMSTDPLDDTRYAKARSLIGVSRTETRDESPDTSLDVPVAHRLPRSSPFSSSQSSNSSILGLDTSPRALIHLGQFDDLSEEDVDFVDASPSRSRAFHQPTFRQPSPSHLIHQGLAESDEARFTSPSLISLIENRIEAEQPRTCYNDGRTFSSTGDDSRHSLLAGSGFDSIRSRTNEEVTEDNGIPIDFLSDPHPWETIGRILNLNPPKACTTQSATIHFTKTRDREGVGYMSPKKLGICYARSPDAASFATRIDDIFMDDTHGVSDVYPSTLDSEVPIMDNHTTTDTGALNPPYTCNSTQPLRSAGLPFIPQAKLHSHIHVRTQAETPSIPVVYCTQNEHTRLSAPLVGMTAIGPDTDVTFDGPCLFGDSDLEEDE